MKTTSAPLLALFNGSDKFFKADLYTITLADGTIIRTTDADRSLTFGGFTFPSCAPSIKRTKVRTVIGVQVDTMTLTINPATTNLIGGFKWGSAARQGVFDGATILVETAYITTWPTVIGTMHAFFGLVSDCEPARAYVTMTIKSALEILSQQFPRNVYQSTCLHTVYDAGCAIAKTSFTATGAVVSGASVNGFTSGLAQATGYFDLGVLTFTSGPLNGIKRTIKSYASGAFTFAYPLPVAPLAGATFSAFAGCDKTKATCGAKFSNLIHFRGFPFIPVPETTF